MSWIGRASRVAHRPNPRDPAKMIDSSHRGMRVALAPLVRGLSATLCVLSMGCLITDDIEFPEEPVCPPAITSPVNAENPLNEIARADPPGAVMGDGGVGVREEEFTVDVWDCNVDQDLDWLMIVNSNPDVPGRLFGDLYLTGTLEEQGTATRALTVTLSDAELTMLPQQCHKVELFVSAEFQPFTTQPRRTGDVATATWWLIVDNDPADGVDFACR